MTDPKGGLSEQLRIFLGSYGIDPMYAVIIFVLILVWSYKGDIKNWEELQGWQKGIIGSIIAGAVILTLINGLRLLGVIVL